MPTETLNEILMRVAMTYTGDTTSYPFNEAMRRAAQFYLDGGGVSPAYVAGRWYPMAAATVGGTGVAAASGTARLAPFTLRRSITVSDLGARVTTTGGGSFQIAIYANDPATMRPTGTVLARTGDISSTSLAAVSADITGANVTLPPGVYWAAVNVDSSSAAAAFTTVGTAFGLSASLVGSATLANVTSAASIVAINLTTPMAYNAWDDMTGATFTEVATGVSAFIFLKAA